MSYEELTNKQVNLELMLENDRVFHNRTINIIEAQDFLKSDMPEDCKHFRENKEELKVIVERHNDYAVRNYGAKKPRYSGDDVVLINISKMTVSGNRLELPQSEQFTNYTAVKKTLLTAGFSYKKNGFESDKLEDLLDRLLSGESVNDKKKFQFFATCKPQVKAVQEKACVEDHHYILEPSAGHGDLVEGLKKENVQCFELFEDNVKILQDKGYQVTSGDFLEIPSQPVYDRILANPPFTKNQDIKHIKHMYEFLNVSGRLVSIASKSWQTGQQKLQKEFRDWLEEVGGEVEEVEAGAFKESGTNVATVIITIDK
jgi:hypothetical protein